MRIHEIYSELFKTLKQLYKRPPLDAATATAPPLARASFFHRSRRAGQVKERAHGLKPSVPEVTPGVPRVASRAIRARSRMRVSQRWKMPSLSRSRTELRASSAWRSSSGSIAAMR